MQCNAVYCTCTQVYSTNEAVSCSAQQSKPLSLNILVDCAYSPVQYSAVFYCILVQYLDLSPLLAARFHELLCVTQAFARVRFLQLSSSDQFKLF